MMGTLFPCPHHFHTLEEGGEIPDRKPDFPDRRVKSFR